VTANVAIGTLLGDTYRIVRRIGSGGMGEVYEATHERLAHRYAVKFLHPGVREHPEALRRFMREAQVTSRLRHPGIVSVVDFNTLPSGVAYLVMEYLEGEPLGKILARTGPMPVSRVVDITDQLSSALTAAHLQGVVHRDMHPQNVFVMPGTGGQSERIKILDFGISKIASVSQKITGMAAVMGTPQYMSPEQAEGKTDELDAASDQFSLAAMVYELLTGRAAFSGQTLASVAYQVVHAAVVPLHSFRPELPRELENVVARGMAKKKQDRFPSVSEFAVHLRWTASLPGSPVPPKASLDENDATPVAADIEETTAVSALPSGMAAVLRQSTGGFAEPVELPDHTPAPARAATPASNTTLGWQIGESAKPAYAAPADDVARARRWRRVATGVAAGVIAFAVVITIGLATRSRKAPSGGATATAPSTPTAPGSPAPPQPPEGEPPMTAARSAAEPAADTPSPAEAAPHSDTVTEQKPAGRGRSRVAGASKAAVPPDGETQAAPPKGDQPKATCSITIGSYPWSELWVDGADTGQQTPVVALPVPCGPHRLELKRRDLKIAQVENVMLNEGREFKRHYELRGAGIDD
jgi:serine/threonine protein kinase